MTTSALVDLKIEMQEKYREYFEEVQADCTKQEQMLIMFAEQHYDIMLELNDQLIQLCQVLIHLKSHTLPHLQVLFTIAFDFTNQASHELNPSLVLSHIYAY